MLNTVIRVGDYVEWFLIPDNYPKNQFDALVNLPCANSYTHKGLWHKWIIDIGGKHSGPRTVHEFHMLDGRHTNIKVDGNRVYIFDATKKTLFYCEGEWCEVLNFDPKKLLWADWLMCEPDTLLGRRWESFQGVVGASTYIQQASEIVAARYIYQSVHPIGFLPFVEGQTL